MPKSNMVYIVDSDPEFCLSTKALLESHQKHVRICENADDFLGDRDCRETDVILLDLDQHKACSFRLLNRLISAAKRPNIILTTALKSVLRPDDRFPGDRVTVLVHPIAPRDLLKAINSMANPVCP